MRKLEDQRTTANMFTPSIFLCATVIAALAIGTATAGEETRGEQKGWKKQNGKKWEAKEKVPAKQFVIKRQLAVNPGGTLTLDADRGSIAVVPANVNVVSVEVIRSIRQKYANDAEAILKHHEVLISKDGNNANVQSRLKPLVTRNVNLDGVGFDASEDVRQALKNAIQKRLQNIKFKVTVPNQYNVKLKTGGQHIVCGDLDGQAHCSTSGGGIKLGKITGKVNASTSGGSLQLAGAGDSVEMRTSGGSIQSGDINGDVVAATSGGSIALGRIRGRVSAKTSGGSIRIVDAGGAVEATTSGGSVSATISQQPTADSYFATSGGYVRVSLAKGLAFDIEHLGRGKASGPFLKKSTSSQAVNTKLNGGGPKLVTKGNVHFAYMNTK